MTEQVAVIDLRDRPSDTSPHTFAYYALKDLQPGQRRVLLAAEDPDLLLRQVQHQMQGRLVWEVAEMGPGLWRVEIGYRTGSHAVTLSELLHADHARLDHLFLAAKQQIATGHQAAAKPLLARLVDGFRQHIDIENRVLVPALPRVHSASGEDAVALMLREHEDILRQLGIIEELADAIPHDPGEIDIWLGLLAAALAKHEHREETLVFPIWDRQLRTVSGGQALVDRVKSLLNEQP